jgi:ribosomal protein S6--L-glutamate ligase
MNVLLVGNPNSYENKRIAAEFVKAGHIFRAVRIKDIIADISENNVTFFDTTGNNLCSYDTYIFRGMGDALWEMLVFAEHLHSIGKTIIEAKMATKRYVMSKLPYTLAQNGIQVIDSKVIFGLNPETESKLSFPLIVKGTQGSRGRSVFKVETLEEFQVLYTKIGPKVLIQPYLPIKFDYRVFCVGEKVIGVIKRYNSEESFLTNVSAGGRAEASDLPDEVKELCLRAKKVSQTEISGVDIIEYQNKYFVLEVNTSPQFQGFEMATGKNIAAEIVEYSAAKYAASR